MSHSNSSTTSGQYYIRAKGRVLGPFTLDQLKSFRDRGKLSRVHEVSTDRKNWQAASRLETLYPRAMVQQSAPTAVASPVERGGEIAELPVVHMPAEWYYNAGGTQQGPVTLDHLRQLLVTGRVAWDEFVWREGFDDWEPASDVQELRIGSDGALSAGSMEMLGFASGSPRRSSGGLTIDDLRDPKERTAFIGLSICAVPILLVIAFFIVASWGIPLIAIGLLWLVRYLSEFFAAAYIKANAVRVSPRQLPELNAIVQRCGDLLGVAPPDVYVMQETTWNAFATKLAGRRLVVLYSGALDSLLLKGDMQQVAFLVGHEIGHHVAGHLDWLHRTTETFGGWFFWLRLWYRRRRELTCDRVGLYCSGSLNASMLALANMTVGAQLADQIDLDEAVRQWHEHRSEFFMSYRTLYSSYPHHLCRLAELQSAAPRLGIAA